MSKAKRYDVPVTNVLKIRQFYTMLLAAALALPSAQATIADGLVVDGPEPSATK